MNRFRLPLLSVLALCTAVVLAVAGWAFTRRQDAAPPPRVGIAAGTAAGQPSRHFALTPPLRAALAARPVLWGGPVAASALEGRIVLVTFFASWCVPCRAELEGLRTLAARRPDVQVLAVNHFETFDALSDEARLTAFLERMALPFPAIRGSDGLMQTFGGVDRIPTLLVFGRDGRLVWAFRNSGPDSAVPDLPELTRRLAELG